MDLEQYKHQLIKRFANPEIRDTLARLCAESSDRIPKWLLPVIREQLASGGEIGRSALVVAAWRGQLPNSFTLVARRNGASENARRDVTKWLRPAERRKLQV